jgi:hypothetical protein
MTVTISVDQKKQLTTFTLVGEISVEDGTKVLKSFYDGRPIEKALWDLRNADLSALSSDDIETFVEYSKRRSQVRAGGLEPKF